ncbi:MAG TPA: alkaline phosphatase family protein [Longimicrobiaceae bacterium]|nr:alkaline phosphatase family protein [Longimicrobiaceae bacterium]
MRHRRWLLLPLLPLLVLAGAWTRAPRPPEQKPALLVLLSVDQLRADLLERYAPYFTGGFHRLLQEGVVYTGVHMHAGTETAPGHATLGTGVYPSHSGIVANNWYVWKGGEWVRVYNVQDTTERIVGLPGQMGMSPRHLMHTGTADWVLAANPAAKVVSISGKDRSAILMAGKSRGDVYWFDRGVGRFITSTYYAAAYPSWVESFNSQVLPTLWDSVWVESSPVAARKLARPDTASYEGDAVHTFFPHSYAVEGKGRKFSAWVGGTPQVDRAVLELVEAAIPATGLGRDSITDYLDVGLSQTDYVGHGYGPLSREQLDNLMKLDKELADFFAYLDRTVGKGRWVAVLSGDHGSTTMPEWQAAHGKPGQRVTAEMREPAEKAAAEAFRNARVGKGPQAAAEAYRSFPFVADAYTLTEVSRGTPRDSFVMLYRHSYYPGRVRSAAGELGVDVRLQEGDYPSHGSTGTGHGSPYIYDRIVPMIFLGGGLEPVRHAGLVPTVDLAPTLARLGGIPVPDDLDGKALPLNPNQGGSE